MGRNRANPSYLSHPSWLERAGSDIFALVPSPLEWSAVIQVSQQPMLRI